MTTVGGRPQDPGALDSAVMRYADITRDEYDADDGVLRDDNVPTRDTSVKHDSEVDRDNFSDVSEELNQSFSLSEDDEQPPSYTKPNKFQKAENEKNDVETPVLDTSHPEELPISSLKKVIFMQI